MTRKTLAKCLAIVGAIFLFGSLGCSSYDKIGAGGHIKVDGLISTIVGVEVKFWIGMERTCNHATNALQSDIYQGSGLTGDILHIPFSDSDDLLSADRGEDEGDSEGEDSNRGGEPLY